MSNTDAAIDTLIMVLNTPRMGNDLRVAAAEGLGLAGGPAARQALMKIVGDVRVGIAVRSAAARALGKATGR
jgi:HEAT repeat protein